MTRDALRLLIVDDEPLARSRARRIAERLGDVAVVGEAGSASEGRRRCEELRPDVVLLDVQMPGEDGFAFLHGLGSRPAIVFVTAFEHYAVRAFEEHAVDYLLKPFRPERLAEALRRAREHLARPEEWSRRMAELVASLARGAPHDALERFTVRVGSRQVILKADQILWFGAEEKLVFAVTDTDRHYVNFTLDQLERRLDPRRFFRVHRAAIANLDRAAAMRPAFAGTYRLQLDDPSRTEIPVSRARARALRERLGG